MSNNDRVSAAIRAVDAELPYYWRTTLQSRTASGIGSVTRYVDHGALHAALLHADWEEYSHPELLEASTAFYTKDVDGFYGMVETTGLPLGTEVHLEDPKATGVVSGVISGTRSPVDYTVIILMVEDGVELAATFHPGPPVSPSQVSAEDLAGKTVTREDALDLGLTRVKIR